MDFDDEWEFLPDTEFLDYHENGKKSKKRLFSNPKTTIPCSGRNYLIIQSPTPHILTPPVPIQLEQTLRKSSSDQAKKEVENPISPVTSLEKKDLNPGLLSVASDQDTVSRVFFKKMKETEFVDMKMDSPKSGNRGITKFPTATDFDSGSAAQEKEMIETEETVNKKSISNTKKEEAIWKGSVKIMGWKLTGMDALCCVGIAAATTICVFIFGRKPRPKQIQFQVYSQDKKSTKQVVNQEPRSDGSVRGSPLTGAHILFRSF